MLLGKYLKFIFLMFQKFPFWIDFGASYQDPIMMSIMNLRLLLYKKKLIEVGSSN